MSNEVYYRIYFVAKNYSRHWTIVEIQDADESNYDPSLFLSESPKNLEYMTNVYVDSKPYRFNTKAEAIIFMNDKVKPIYIDPAYCYQNGSGPYGDTLK